MNLMISFRQDGKIHFLSVKIRKNWNTIEISKEFEIDNFYSNPSSGERLKFRNIFLGFQRTF